MQNSGAAFKRLDFGDMATHVEQVFPLPTSLDGFPALAVECKIQCADGERGEGGRGAGGGRARSTERRQSRNRELHDSIKQYDEKTIRVVEKGGVAYITEII